MSHEYYLELGPDYGFTQRASIIKGDGESDHLADLFCIYSEHSRILKIWFEFRSNFRVVRMNVVLPEKAESVDFCRRHSRGLFDQMLNALGLRDDIII